jgi:hypothetical protein
MLSLLLAAAVAQASAFDAATQAYSNVDVPAAKRLLNEAAAHDPDPHRRARAELWLANIAWHIDHDAGAARKTLDLVVDEESIPAAWIERARIDEELTDDFDAARAEAQHALDAPKITDRLRAVTLHAGAAIVPALRGKNVDPALLEAAKKELHDSIERDGPYINVARMWLDGAVVTDDGPAALAAWRAYFGATAKSSILGPAELALAKWSDRRGAGLALARSGFFREAAFVLHGIADRERDKEEADVIAYAAYTEKLRTIADDYYRDVALRRADPKAFRAAIEREDRALGMPLSRFNAVRTLGNTANLLVMHYGHKVLDDRRDVTQFGRTAPLNFVLLDGIVSNGFLMWYGPAGGDGGWATADAIYQVRPMYANGPLRQWQDVTDPVMHAERERELNDETARDAERAAIEPVRFFPGTQLRLMRQYNESVLDELKRAGLAGDTLRDAFIARVERDTFESSIWAHEGRHAIDKNINRWMTSPELEYRAKLSQLEFAPSARHALIDIGGNGNVEFGDTPHGKGNRRVANDLAQWMRAHAGEIKDADKSKPLMLQLDKLNDDQIRAAARAADPLAK